MALMVLMTEIICKVMLGDEDGSLSEGSSRVLEDREKIWMVLREH